MGYWCREGCQPHEKQTALNKRALTGQDLSTALVSWDACPQLRRGAFCHCRDLDENIDIDLPEVSPLAWLGSMGFRWGAWGSDEGSRLCL